MSDFAIATLTPLPKGGRQSRTNRRSGQRDTKNAVEVQFNPTSLKLQRQGSQVRGGLATKTQQVQYPSSKAATLSFDLEFDTAEESVQGRAVDVRTRTAKIYRFLEPSGSSPASAPHRILFEWGTFAFQGVVTQLTEDFDYFAPDGTPLRAKLSLTIEEQNPKYEATAQGNGARNDAPAADPEPSVATPAANAASIPPPGAPPGHSGTREPQMIVPAQAGESVQQLAARIGGDPAAWRSLMNDLPGPTELAAGTPVIVGPELDTSTGPGRARGFAEGASVAPARALADALGLPSGADGVAPAAGAPAAGAPTGSAEAAGFALSAAGGVAAATNQVRAAEAAAAVEAARSAFAAPSSVRCADVREPARDPSRRTGAPAFGAVDPRAIAYGRSIPLRSQVYAPTAGDIRNSGRRSIAGRARPTEVAVEAGASAKPWERLAPAGGGRADADRAQRGRDARASTMRWRPGGDCR